MCRLLVSLCLLMLSTAVSATVTMAPPYGDKMVLQRDTEVLLKGQASTEQKVTVFVDGKRLGEAAVDHQRWSYRLPAFAAGGPHTIKISGENTLLLNDILFGDVWLASGQSNMELPMYRVEEAFPQDVANANFPDIREFTVPDEYNFNGPQDHITKGQWRSATKDNIRSLSAVAYYFAKNIHQQEHVPVGIINASLGGSPIEAWMSAQTLASYPQDLKEGQRFADETLITQIKTADQQRQQAWYSRLDEKDKGLKAHWYASEFNDDNWQTLVLPGDLPEAKNTGFSGSWWIRKNIVLAEQPTSDVVVRLGRIVDADEVYINGKRVGNTTYQYPPRRYVVAGDVFHKGNNTVAVRITSVGQNTGLVTDKQYFVKTQNETVSLKGDWRYKVAAEVSPLAPQTFIRWKPMGLYNAMISPLTDYAIKGALWYQGESNTGHPGDYQDKLVKMVKQWRKDWGSAFPFLVVQLANFMERKNTPSDSLWAQLREQQQKATDQLDNAATIVTIDLGEWNDIHPVNKAEVGHRLALAARHIAYGEPVDDTGPSVASAVVNQNTVTLTFDEQSLPMSLSSPPHNGFAIAGADKQFVWADVELKDRQVLLHSEKVPHPVFVRYAWGDNPEAGLFDANNLPAAPFRLDLRVTKEKPLD